jgi:hypothetical protein
MTSALRRLGPGGAVCQPHAVQALECAIELPSIHLTAHNDQPYLPCPKDALVYARPAFLRPCALTLTPTSHSRQLDRCPAPSYQVLPRLGPLRMMPSTETTAPGIPI